MTKEQLESLIPRKTMVYAKSDGVGYTFMEINSDGKYQLCGMPFGYHDYTILNCFEIKDEIGVD